ncbi:MAG TPA: phosphonate ABC transporter ATP-binding protein [Chloroflexota bacterium]|jgi:phosphonate transport system ATP-binding protein
MSGVGAPELAPAAVVIADLRKRYGRATVALDAISLSVAQGEFVAILGPNGAGKTTLLRCLLRLTEPDGGQFQVGGHDVTHTHGEALARARRETAAIFQQFNLVARLTAVENVLAGRLAVAPLWRVLLRAFPRGERMRALHALDRVGLLEQAYQRADTLSGGQQQRVAIARALAQEPRLILADEPVASLDPESAATVLRTLREACDADGVTVLCTLHQVAHAREYASRALGLSGGRLVADVPIGGLDSEVLGRIYGRVLRDRLVAS